MVNLELVSLFDFSLVNHLIDHVLLFSVAKVSRLLILVKGNTTEI